MLAQDLAASLCQEGGRHLARGESSLATAFFLAAFSCHAPTAVGRVHALPDGQGAAVQGALEAWCRGQSHIPAIHWDGMAVVSLTGALASAFLATLLPGHPAAALHRLAGLLARGRPLEAERRCSALLAAHSPLGLELRLTRALARVLAGAPRAAGLADYLQAFAASSDRTVAFVLAHQQPHLPELLGALRDHISGCLEAPDSGDSQRLLAALDATGSWSDSLPPEALLRAGRFEACRAACSRLLESQPTGSRPQGERLAALLVTRAAAAFFLDSGTQDTLRDLHAAFSESRAGARRQLDALFPEGARERLRARAEEAAASGFAHFLEAVRGRTELRRDSGRELLPPVIRALRVLLRVAPPAARPAVGTRLAECLLLAGDAAGARAWCERLLRPSRRADPAGERSALLALRGFCALHAGDSPRALEDFQEVVAQGPPHPSACVRALCGRGLLRVLAGSAFLGTLDYVTACRLLPEEAMLVAKAFVPWNQRGLLRTVLREEARTMLQRPPRLGGGCEAPERARPSAQEGDAHGVLQLASLLLELDEEDEVSRLLVADALYVLGRVEEAHKTLLRAQSCRPQAAPVLARLALLQLRRGFSYDAHQLVKKLVQCGDTAHLQPTLDIFCHGDRQLLWHHCHAQATAILRAPPGTAEEQAHIRRAVAYLSLAIFAAGGSCPPPQGAHAVPGTRASESLLARARCYALLGQRKTALLDLNSALRAEPGNAAALCGRGLLHHALGRQQEAVDDVFCALKLDPRAAVRELRALKPEVRALITQGLSAHCRALLGQVRDPGTPLSPDDAQGLQAAGEALISLDRGRCSWHILLADVLTATGSYEEAGARLQAALHPCPPSEAARARRGLLQLKKGDAAAAARDLQGLAEADASDLRFLLGLLGAQERQSLAQVAAQEAGGFLQSGQPGQALGYCSLAVLASQGQASHLRLRAACLAELQDFERALGDLDLVLRAGPGAGDAATRAEDFCCRGRALLGVGDAAGAAGAFSQALRLAPLQAQSSLGERPGRATAAHLLLGWGQHCLEEQRLPEAWAAAQGGLALDPSHCRLRSLKARVRREVASGCRLH